MAELWKGAPVAAALTERLCGQAERLRARGISPTLAIVRVGGRDRIVRRQGTFLRLFRQRLFRIGLVTGNIRVFGDIDGLWA